MVINAPGGCTRQFFTFYMLILLFCLQQNRQRPRSGPPHFFISLSFLSFLCYVINVCYFYFYFIMNIDINSIVDKKKHLIGLFEIFAESFIILLLHTYLWTPDSELYMILRKEGLLQRMERKNTFFNRKKRMCYLEGML